MNFEALWNNEMVLGKLKWIISYFEINFQHQVIGVIKSDNFMKIDFFI